MAVVFAGPVMNLLLCFILMPLVLMIGRTQYKLLDEPPVVIEVKANSPAQAAGLQAGDKILALDDELTPDWEELMRQIAIIPVGDTVILRYARQGAESEVKITTSSNDRFKKVTGLNQEISYLGIEYYEFHDNDPLVGDVTEDSPAAAAGFLKGDKVTAINHQAVRFWSEMTSEIQALQPPVEPVSSGCNADLRVPASHPLKMDILRNGQALTLEVTPKFNEKANAWIIGVGKVTTPPELLVMKQYGPVQAIVSGFGESLRMIKLTGKVLWGLITGKVHLSQIGGPVQIAKVTGDAATAGFGEYLFILAFLSLNLGVMNLLPIPVLDGGHIFFMALEGLRRRPLSPRFRQISTQMGLITLLLLMLLVTANDMNSVFGVDLVQKLKGLF
jgi:regulator of sigma E protease